MTTESMEFEIRAGQALATIRQLQRANSDLGKAAQMAGESAAKGNKSAEQSFKEYWTNIARNQKAIHELRQEVARFNESGKSGFMSGGKGQQAIQQLAYAADDAATSFGTGGFAGAIRGASNNLSTMLLAVNPLYGALAGVGLAIGGTFVKRWEDAAKAVDASADSMERAKNISTDYARKLADLQESIAELSGEEEKAIEIREQKRRVEILEKPKAELLAAEKQRTEIDARIASLDKMITKADGGESGAVYAREREKLAIEREGLPDVERLRRNVNALETSLDQEAAARRAKYEREKSKKDADRNRSTKRGLGRFAESATSKIDAGLREQASNMLRGGMDVNAVVQAIRPSIEQTLGEESFGLIPGIESLAGREASRIVGEEREKMMAISPTRRKLETAQAEQSKAQRAVENARIDAMKDGRMDAGEKRTIQDLRAAAGALKQAANALRDQVAEEENKLPQMDRNAGL